MKAVDELEVLSRTAATYPPRTARGIRLPSLLFFTDPARITNPEAVAERLPKGAGIVLRAFGAADAVDQGRRLRTMATARGLILLVGADETLADAVDADGLHLPERYMDLVPDLRARHPSSLITIAAHDLAAVRAASAHDLDALVVSPVFASNSPSAGRALGLDGLRALVTATDKPVYALGGIRAQTVDSLKNSGIAGFAAVEAFSFRT